jgi:hypothetical protein
MPSDVIWAATIAGGVGLLGNGATLWATALQRRSHERTEAKHIDADADRLGIEHREAERQRRFGMYEALVRVMNDLDRASTWASPTDEEVESLVAHFLELHANVLLLGSEHVCEASSPVSETLNLIGTDLVRIQRLDASQGLAAAHATAYKQHRDPLIDAEAALLLAMREDVRRGYEEEPPASPRA